jgi:hypothetical protein
MMDSFYHVVTFIFCQAILTLQSIYARVKIAWQKICQNFPGGDLQKLAHKM